MFFEMGKTVEIFKKAGEAITAMTSVFDSAKDLKERVTRHIPTENEKLEGQRHPVTDVEYRKKTIRVGTELIEGVFRFFRVNLIRNCQKICGKHRRMSNLHIVQNSWQKG